MDLTYIRLGGHCIKMLAPVSWWLEVILTAAPVLHDSHSAVVCSLSTHVLMDAQSSDLLLGHRCTLCWR